MHLLPFAGFLRILNKMDERTKSIFAIEQKTADETAQINKHLRRLGQLLLERSKDGRIAIDRAAYEKTNEELARLEAAILQVEHDAERVIEIDNLIADEERLNDEAEGRLAVIYPDLGKSVTEDETFEAFSAPYKTRIIALEQKIDGLNGRLNEIDEKGSSNIFSWLGRGAQSLAIKSFLAKAETSRERVYAEAGAEFAYNRPSNGQKGSGALEELYTFALLQKKEESEREKRIAALKEEKRELLGSFGREGNANRKKAEIRRRIVQLDRELNDLYLRLGRKAEDPSTRLVLQSLFDDEMGRILEDTAHCRERVRDYEDQTARLRTSLDIDEERADIEKFKKSIAAQRQRIAVAEEIIAQYEKRITEADKHIADMMKN
jgi:hypothetical protein